MKTWLMRVIAAAILCTIAQDLSPKGSVKQVGRLVCAMVLLCVVLSPVKTLDMAAGSQWLTNYRATLADSRVALAEQGEEIQMAVIGEKYRAYIEDKGVQLGLNCQAQVDCREEGEIYVPDRVQVTGTGCAAAWRRNWACPRSGRSFGRRARREGAGKQTSEPAGPAMAGAAGHLSLGADRGGGGGAAHGPAHREREKRR